MLEGGLPAWKAVGGPTDTSPATDQQLQVSKQAARQSPSSTKYKAALKKDKVGEARHQPESVSVVKQQSAQDMQPLPTVVTTAGKCSPSVSCQR